MNKCIEPMVNCEFVAEALYVAWTKGVMHAVTSMKTEQNTRYALPFKIKYWCCSF